MVSREWTYSEIPYLVTANLKLSHVPGCILVGRALHMSKLGLVGRIVVMNIERDLN